MMDMAIHKALHLNHPVAMWQRAFMVVMIARRFGHLEDLGTMIWQVHGMGEHL